MPKLKLSKSTKISVFVKPGSKKGPLIVEDSNDKLTVFVREKAVDNQANQALIELLSDYFDVPKSQLLIISGHSSRHKIITRL